MVAMSCNLSCPGDLAGAPGVKPAERGAHDFGRCTAGEIAGRRKVTWTRGLGRLLILGEKSARHAAPSASQDWGLTPVVPKAYIFCDQGGSATIYPKFIAFAGNAARGNTGSE